MAKLSLAPLPTMGSPHLKGGKAEASTASAAARKGTQEPKSAARLTALWSPPQAGLMLASGPCSLPTTFCPTG